MKHLYRSKTNKKIAGVCAGFAEYFELDVTLIRIVWLTSILLGGTGLVLYLVCWLLMPENPEAKRATTPLKPLTRSATNKVLAGVCGGLGDYFQVDPILFRIAFIILTIGVGWGIFLYIILWIAVPLETNRLIR